MRLDNFLYVYGYAAMQICSDKVLKILAHKKVLVITVRS